MPVDTMMEKAGVTTIVGEVTAIDTEGKTVTLADGMKIGFQKLVLATGSTR